MNVGEKGSEHRADGAQERVRGREQIRGRKAEQKMNPLLYFIMMASHSISLQYAHYYLGLNRIYILLFHRG